MKRKRDFNPYVWTADDKLRFSAEQYASIQCMAKFDALPKELRDEANEVGLNRVLKRVGSVRRDGDA